MKRPLYKPHLCLRSLAIPQRNPSRTMCSVCGGVYLLQYLFFAIDSSKQNLSHQLPLKQKLPGFLSEGNGHFKTIVWALRMIFAAVLTVSRHLHQSQAGSFGFFHVLKVKTHRFILILPIQIQDYTVFTQHFLYLCLLSSTLRILILKVARVKIRIFHNLPFVCPILHTGWSQNKNLNFL